MNYRFHTVTTPQSPDGTERGFYQIQPEWFPAPVGRGREAKRKA